MACVNQTINSAPTFCQWGTFWDIPRTATPHRTVLNGTPCVRWDYVDAAGVPVAHHVSALHSSRRSSSDAPSWYAMFVSTDGKTPLKVAQYRAQPQAGSEWWME